MSTDVLPDPGACDDQQRRPGVHHRLALLWVQSAKQFLSTHLAVQATGPLRQSPGPALLHQLTLGDFADTARPGVHGEPRGQRAQRDRGARPVVCT